MDANRNGPFSSGSQKGQAIKIFGMRAGIFIILMIILGCISGGIITNIAISLTRESPQWRKIDTSSQTWEQFMVLIKSKQGGEEYDCGSPDSRTSFKKGKVIDSFAVRECFIDGYVDQQYVLLEDGTIWSRTIGVSAMEGSQNFMTLVVVSIGGALLFLFLAIQVVQRKRSQKSD